MTQQNFSKEEYAEAIVQRINEETDYFIEDQNDAEFFDDGTAHVSRKGVRFAVYAYNNIDETWNEAREQRYLNKLVATIEGVEQ